MTATPARPNLHEHLARERKAAALADVLAVPNFDRATVAAMTPDQRDLVAQIAGQRPPSDETWARCLQLLGHRYDVRAALTDVDPFDGLTS